MPAIVDPLARNSVRISGLADGAPLVFAHGFGGSKDSWRFVAPAFESDHRVIVFDQAGAGDFDLTAYDRARYDSLNGYADDLIEILDALDTSPVIYVGHSVSSIVGILAANQRPELFREVIMLGPSPRYIDDASASYTGGFSQQSIDDLLTSMDTNYGSWTADLAPLLMNHPERPELSADLEASIRSADPEISAQFARATFLGDNRRDLTDVTVPVVILQGAQDNIASPVVGRYVEQHVPGSRLLMMDTRGHIPHLSAPDEVIRNIRAALE